GAGEPLVDGDALFGSTVNLTARICATADPGQILVSRVVRDLCSGKLFTFRRYGEVNLKGFPDPVEVHEVDWVRYEHESICALCGRAFGILIPESIEEAENDKLRLFTSAATA